MDGKAMIVATRRRIAVELYREQQAGQVVTATLQNGASAATLELVVVEPDVPGTPSASDRKRLRVCTTPRSTRNNLPLVRLNTHRSPVAEHFGNSAHQFVRVVANADHRIRAR